MISAESAQKFEALFTDESIEKEFFEWHEALVKDRKSKRTLWQKIKIHIPFVLIMAFVILFIFCLFGNQVEQEVRKYDDGVKFYTLVWYNGNIVKSWYTPADEITDSAKISQKQLGEQLLQTLKK